MIAIMSAFDFFTELQGQCAPATIRRVTLAPQEVLFRQGDTPLGLVLVLEGQMDLIRWTAGGRSIRIHRALRHETFAEASLFAQACHCDAVAAKATVLTILPRRTVLDAFAAKPDLSSRFTTYLAQSLMDARRLLEVRALHPLPEGLMARLAELVDGNDDLPANISLLSLAQDLDVTAPALYRALAKLEKEGRVIRPARGRVRLVR
jgi:CRP-like cAMP-binding protein